MSTEITDDGNQLILLVYLYRKPDGEFFIRGDSLPKDKGLLADCGTACKKAIEEVAAQYMKASKSSSEGRK